MSLPPFDFVLLWTVILGLGVFFYVLLDGFDLGVGILYGVAAYIGRRAGTPWEHEHVLEAAPIGRSVTCFTVRSCCSA